MLTTSDIQNGRGQQLQRQKMPDDVAISVEKVSVCYRMPTERINTLKEQMIRVITRRTVRYHEFWALRDVTLHIKRGESVALIGRNGAGKSTLLKVIARVQQPTKGRIIVRGSVAPIIELGAGFHPELTGRENIFVNGAMLGFSRNQMRKKIDGIVDFSELGTFIDSPIRTYSSGMVARLAFSIAAEVDPDLLIIDEVLSVGDEAFQHKCKERMLGFKRRGVTILYVTHAVGEVHTLCDKAIWIDEGCVRYVGDTQDVVGLYRAYVENGADMGATQKRQVVAIRRK